MIVFFISLGTCSHRLPIFNHKPDLVYKPSMEKGTRHKLRKQDTQTERSNNFLPLKTQKCKLVEKQKVNKIKFEKNVNVSENMMIL